MVEGYCDNTAFLSAIRHLVISFDEQRSLIERDRNINRTPIEDHTASRKRGGGRKVRCHIGAYRRDRSSSSCGQNFRYLFRSDNVTEGMASYLKRRLK